jgi:tetratricopeptide (TPR) repeat protein
VAKASVKLFLSCVSGEFGGERDFLRGKLTRPNVEVKIQEDFKALGGDTLVLLAKYIEHCGIVVHFAGDMTGSTPSAVSVEDLLKKWDGLEEALARRGLDRTSLGELTYTQWEAWLAIGFGKELVIVRPMAGVAHAPGWAPTPESRAAQDKHLARLRAINRYPAIFTSADNLVAQLYASAIFDAMVKAELASTIEVNPGVLSALVRQHGEHSKAQKKEIKRLSAQLRLSENQMREALRILGATEVSSQDYGRKLIEVANGLKSLKPIKATNETPAIAMLQAEAERAIEATELVRADELLGQIDAEQKKLVEKQVAGRVETLARRADIALTQLRYREAAQYFSEAAAMLGASEAQQAKRVELLEREADTLFRQGTEFGDNEALRLAIGRRLTLIALRPRSLDPEFWARMQYELGRTLWRLGERENGTARLEEAAAAHRAALEVRTRERSAREWAWSRNELGNVLRVLGTRQGKAEWFEQAVVAYREALEVRTRSASPGDWAMGQNNLGAALRGLGGITGETTKLEEAIEAYGAALQVWTPSNSPRNWAMAQGNLGNALMQLGERRADLALLEKAVAAHRASLTVFARPRYPHDWAMAQMNMGGALSTLGQLESGTKRLNDAVEAYRQAMLEFTPAAAPFFRAQVQHALDDLIALIVARESAAPA